MQHIVAGKKNDALKGIKGNNKTGEKIIEASLETWTTALSDFVYLFGTGWGVVHTDNEIKNKKERNLKPEHNPESLPVFLIIQYIWIIFRLAFLPLR